MLNEILDIIEKNKKEYESDNSVCFSYQTLSTKRKELASLGSVLGSRLDTFKKIFPALYQYYSFLLTK